MDATRWGLYALAITMIPLSHGSLGQSGSVQVFDPDPVTVTGDISLRDNSNPSRFLPAYSSKDVSEIKKIDDGSFVLESSNVILGDFELPTNDQTISPDGRFVFERGTSGFRDSMAFYHLDANARYVESLGFVGEKHLGNTPLKVDTDALYGDRGAFYVPSENLILLGTGCIDAAEDADELHRLYFYSVVQAVRPELKGGDTSAIIEALADYWAVSRSLDSGVGAERFATGIFQWSSRDGCGFSRSVGKSSVKYNPSTTYLGNQAIPGGVSNQLISVPLYEALVQGRTQGLEKTHLDQMVIESLQLLRDGMTIRQYSMAFLELLEQSGFSRDIWQTFVHRFQQKDILPASQISLFEARYRVEDGGEISRGSVMLLDFRLSNTGDLEAEDVELSITAPNDNIDILDGTWTQKSLPHGGADVVGQLKFKVTDGSICDDGGVIVNLDLSYNDLFNHRKSTQQTKFEIWNFRELKSVELEIPDNSEAGVVSTIQVDTPSTKFELLIDMDIAHPAKGDLEILIENPQGLKKTLWFEKGAKGNDIKGTFPTTLKPRDSLEDLMKQGAQGPWKLKVIDIAKRDVGKLVSWGIRIKNGICE